MITRILFFALLFSQFSLAAQEVQYRREGDELTWILTIHDTIEESSYTIQQCDFNGKITTVRGTVSKTDGVTVFNDTPAATEPSIVDGKQFLEMKDGQQVYLVEKACEKEFTAALKEKEPFLRSMCLKNYFRQLGTSREAQFLINRPREEIKARHAKDSVQENDDMIVVESVIDGIPCTILYLMNKDGSRSSFIGYHFKPKETLSFNEGLALGRKLINDFVKSRQVNVTALKLRGLPFSEVMGDMQEHWPYDYVQCYGMLDEKYAYNMTISGEKQDGKPDSRLTSLSITISAPPPPPTAPL